MKELMDMHLRGPLLPEEERNELGKEIYRIIVDNMHNIGIVGLSPMVQGVIVTNANLRNVPETGGNDWPLRTPSTGYPEQFFYAQ
jgi:peptide/nickel transport system substrate-binding protein